jgi:hypothetical protein
MLFHASTGRIGFYLSIATCALAVCAQTKSLLIRHSETSLNPEFSSHLGVESAWPHLRQDFGDMMR